MGMRSRVHRGDRVVSSMGEEEGRLPRALTKSGAGERNRSKRMGEKRGECGPQKDCELVTTPEAVCFL